MVRPNVTFTLIFTLLLIVSFVESIQHCFCFHSWQSRLLLVLFFGFFSFALSFHFIIHIFILWLSVHLFALYKFNFLVEFLSGLFILLKFLHLLLKYLRAKGY